MGQSSQFVEPKYAIDLFWLSVKCVLFSEVNASHLGWAVVCLLLEFGECHACTSTLMYTAGLP